MKNIIIILMFFMLLYCAFFIFLISNTISFHYDIDAGKLEVPVTRHKVSQSIFQINNNIFSMPMFVQLKYKINIFNIFFYGFSILRKNYNQSNKMYVNYVINKLFFYNLKFYLFNYKSFDYFQFKPVL